MTEELVPDLRANDVNLKELKENDLLQPIFEVRRKVRHSYTLKAPLR